MIVTTITGRTVSIVNKAFPHLEDSHGNKWFRNQECDTLECTAYIKYAHPQDTILLTREEMARIEMGNTAINTPTTVEEMREYAHSVDEWLGSVVDGWPDQALREMLIDAEEKGISPSQMLEECAKGKPRVHTVDPKAKEGPSEATGAHRAPKTGRSIPRRRKQEGSLSVALEDTSVVLTPKQLEFMERLSECPDWEESGPAGTYVASEYAQELTDTMNPMSVGAVLTTLREKHILTTEKRRIGAIKCCVFQLTDLGVRLYNKLSER